MNISWDCSITVDGVDIEVTVEAICGHGGDATITHVELEGEDILDKLELWQAAELETQALNIAQAKEDINEDFAG